MLNPLKKGKNVIAAKGYCILNMKPVDEWNKYYNLKHYVVIYLEIKD